MFHYFSKLLLHKLDSLQLYYQEFEYQQEYFKASQKYD